MSSSDYLYAHNILYFDIIKGLGSSGKSLVQLTVACSLLVGNWESVVYNSYYLQGTYRLTNHGETETGVVGYLNSHTG